MSCQGRGQHTQRLGGMATRGRDWAKRGRPQGSVLNPLLSWRVSRPMSLGEWQMFSQPPLQLGCKEGTRIPNQLFPLRPLSEVSEQLGAHPGRWGQLPPAPQGIRGSVASRARPGRTSSGSDGACAQGQQQCLHRSTVARCRVSRPALQHAHPTPRDLSPHPWPWAQAGLVPCLL